MAGVKRGRGARRLIRRGACILTVLTLASVGSAAQVFRSQVDLVQMQVTVEDAAGAFVSGLTKDHFTVLVNGEARPVQALYEVDLPRQPLVGGEGAGGAVDFPGTPLAARRYFMLLFDFALTSRQGLLRVKKAAQTFLAESVASPDLVGVASVSRSGVAVPVPFSGDLELARNAVDAVKLSDAGDLIVRSDGGGIPGAPGASLDISRRDYPRYVAEVAAYLEGLEAFAEMMQAIEGRKHLVMFSRGFLDHALVGPSLDRRAEGSGRRAGGGAGDPGELEDPDYLTGSTDLRAQMRELVEKFQEADVVIYAVDPTGLAAEEIGHQSLMYLADGTGGEAVWNANDLRPALRQIAEATRRFYVLGYRREPADPPAVRIQVRVADPRVQTVRAPERLAPPPAYAQMSAAQRQLQLAVAMSDDVGTERIAVASQVRGFIADDGSGVLVAYLEVPAAELERLAAQKQDAELRFELMGLAVVSGEGIVGQFRRGVALKVEPSQRGELPGAPFRYVDEITVPPGRGRLRLLVREAGIGELTVVNRDYEVTAAPRGTIAEPMVVEPASDRAFVPPEESLDVLHIGGRSLVPVASPRVVPGGTLLVLVPVIHADEEPGALVAEGDLAASIEPGLGAAPVPLGLRLVDSERSRSLPLDILLVRLSVPETTAPGEGLLNVKIGDATGATRILIESPALTPPHPPNGRRCRRCPSRAWR